MRRPNDGFTLIENLIAVVVAGGMIMGGTMLVSQVRARLRIEVEKLHAAFDAEAIIAEVTIPDTEYGGALSGTRPDGLRYRIDFAPYDWPPDIVDGSVNRHLRLRKLTAYIWDDKDESLFKLATLVAMPERLP